MHAVLFREFLRVSPLSSAGAPLHVCCVGRASRLTACGCARVSESGPSVPIACTTQSTGGPLWLVRKPLCVSARSCYDTKILPYTISLIPTSRRARVTLSTVLRCKLNIICTVLHSDQCDVTDTDHSDITVYCSTVPTELSRQSFAYCQSSGGPPPHCGHVGCRMPQPHCQFHISIGPKAAWSK